MIKSRRYPKKIKRNRKQSVRRGRKISGGGGTYTLTKPDNTKISDNALTVLKTELNNISVNKDTKPLYTITVNIINGYKSVNKESHKRDTMPVKNIDDISTINNIILTPIQVPIQVNKSIFSNPVKIFSNPVKTNFINAISNIYLIRTDDEHQENKEKTIVHTEISGETIGMEPYRDGMKYNGIKYNDILKSTSIVTLTPAYFIINNDGEKKYFCIRYHNYVEKFTARSGTQGGYFKVYDIAKLYDDIFEARVLKYYNAIRVNKPPSYNTTNIF